MLCVIAKLDGAATEKLQALRSLAFPPGEAGLPLHGHITLATYVGKEEARFLEACRELLRDAPAFSVRYGRLEVLEETSILAALPEPSPELEALHRRIAAAFPADLDLWTGTERWRAHTTLYYSPEADLESLLRRMETAFTPFTAHISAVEFSRVLESGYEILGAVKLSG